jgi:hypothetical protein
VDLLDVVIIIIHITIIVLVIIHLVRKLKNQFLLILQDLVVEAEVHLVLVLALVHVLVEEELAAQ